VFTFPAARTTTTAPKAVEEPAPVIEDDETPLELGSDEDTEELVLDAEDVLTSPVGAPPIAPPTDEDENEATDEAPAASGGTLFERMSNIARGAPKAQLDEDDDAAPGFKSEPIDIPRFLNRQNNQ
jgi:cell division protein FtsZ